MCLKTTQTQQATLLQSIVERLLDKPSLEQTALSNLVYINVHSISVYPPLQVFDCQH